MSSTRMPLRAWLWSALSGLIGGASFLAAAELVALAVARQASPVLAVGSFIVDVVPQPLKEFAIATFGEYDKIVLLIGIGVAVAVAAAISGVLQYVRPPLGVVAFAIAGILATAATVTRAGATVLSALPPVVGTLVGSIVLMLVVNRLRRWLSPRRKDAPDTAGAEAKTGAAQDVAALDRRGFFRISAIAGASAVVVGVGARALSAATSSLGAIREELTLPAPRTTVTVPEGAEFDIDGLSPLITPNADFYRVDTALTVPSVDPSTWRLVIDGMVDERVELTFDDLIGMGVDEYAVTLTCVSNEVGGGLVGNAVWLGVPIRDVLARAGVHDGADMVLSRSVDGYTASTPLASLTDDGLDAIFAVGMNGEPLPVEHGFPVRMVVPGLYGYVSATKWVTELKVTTFAEDEAYWTPRGYSAEAPIKFSSRIDTPRTGTPVSAGTVPIAGMAWAQTVGIERVEVSIDDGDWQQATVSTPINDDTWVQWYLEWEAEPGTHYVAVRAVNADGELQTEERAPIAPNGSSGWQRVLVTVQ
ncbi:molybdopterin-dependent oxidoreductase [Microbacterium xanthum]|uniref:molybdopterin-dependent oxidoreductase n=1 Tax=Microbacterium xanthum TaxID=3079794 RepID=UPI002AD48B93|nr:molybdopterin-dependent oxidoreductase [Microbacterium sp. KSW-48]MDZ8171479.1 molybdopterin-dependent oxidoreductase [Microbacterium sp. KSW-48]